MNTHSLAHVEDGQLLRDLTTLVVRERKTTAEVLAHLAEVEERKLYLPAACSSMFDYCVRELRFSEQAALRRIRVARAGRRYPAIFVALAEGRLNLTSVLLLTPYLSDETIKELVELAAYRTKSEIEGLLSQRFSESETLELRPAESRECQEPTPSSPPCQLSLATVSLSNVKQDVMPPAPPQFSLHVRMDQRTRDQLRYAQELLSHRIPSGDAGQVISLALDALVAQLEKRRFAGTARPRSKSKAVTGRTIPAAVKREVWKRDGAQCTFVSEAGRRCSSRKFLEFDHVLEFALGGRATADGIRLRCRAHNQHTAEETFGAAFMERKRERARSAATERARAATMSRAQSGATPAGRDVVPWLRALGFSAVESRRAAALCESMHAASLEERVRLAIRSLRPGRRFSPATSNATEYHSMHAQAPA